MDEVGLSNNVDQPLLVLRRDEDVPLRSCRYPAVLETQATSLAIVTFAAIVVVLFVYGIVDSELSNYYNALVIIPVLLIIPLWKYVWRIPSREYRRNQEKDWLRDWKKSGA